MSSHAIFSIQSPDKNLTLEFCPSVGGCITSFRKDSINLFRPWDGINPLIPGNTASFPMTPVSNRIANCKLEFEGKTYEILPPFGEEPNYLHGDGWTSAWDIKSQGPHHVTLGLKQTYSSLSPYDYEAEQSYHLENDTLHIDMAIMNTGRRLPFGMGHHPYFPRTENTVVKANLPKVWLCDGNMHPTELIDTPEKWNFARGVRMADPVMLPPSQGFRGRDLIDNCFPGWDGRAEILQPNQGLKIIVTADPIFAHMVIYNPPLDRNFFVLEAVSNIIDAFNQMARGVENTGTVILDKGETMKGRTSFTVLPL
jgi:aldose 1-epimerase